MDKKVFYVYALVDKYGVPFYVGISSNPRLRCMTHIYESRGRYKKKKTNKNKKIRSIRKVDLMILDSVITESQHTKESISLERYWMWQLKSWGFNLTNTFPELPKKTNKPYSSFGVAA